MSRKHQINTDPAESTLRHAATAATEPVRSIGWALEERVLWKGADLGTGLARRIAEIVRRPFETDLARKIAEIVRWPFERLAWLLERHVIWPLQERTAGRGPSGHLVAAGALATVAIGATALGVIAMAEGGNDRQQVVAAIRMARVASAERSPAVVEKPAGPMLHGAPPSFDIGSGVGVADSASGDVSAAVGADTNATSAAEAATTSSQKAVPAGPAAMKVARRFADAFVFYEVGAREKRAHSVFAETATPELEKALVERPPRQPENVDVPQARVLNLVPGPRHGNTYTVSASLLRVDTTSELRLEMRKLNGSWVVTDVRG